MRFDRFLLTIAAPMALSGITALPAAAHENEGEHQHPVAVADEHLHRPSAMPDRIVLTWTNDPTTSQAVTWRTDGSVTKAMAEIAEAGHGPDFVDQRRAVEATTTPLQTNLGLAHYHTARFENLEPATMYAYRVGDGVNWSEWIHFATAHEGPAPFSFIYFGDAQNDIRSMWSRVLRQAYGDAPKAAFIIHAGDLVNVGDNDAEWGEWFSAGGWVNAMTPSIPVPGNHEYSLRHQSGERRKALSPHWHPQFALPENGPEGLEETAYYIDYQDVRIIALNTNERIDEQAAWLEQVLTLNPNRWTVVTFHHPVFSAARKRDNPKIRKAFQPLLERYGVDLVLQGHDHTYARGPGMTEDNVATGLTVRENDTGPVYVVSVSGPKMYDLDRENWMRRAAWGTQLYQVIHIDGGTLRYEARTAAGELYDQFELRKETRLVEEAVEMEERLDAEPPHSPSTQPAIAGGERS